MSVRLTDVRREFSAGAGKPKFVAVKDVSLDLDGNSSIGIVGESGSGKSTLARMIVGLDVPSSGSLSVNGQPIGRLLEHTDSRRDLRRLVQLVAQDTSSSFDPRRSLRDSVRFPAMKLCGLSKSAADARADELLASIGVDPALLERFPRQVSGGQRQRIALARALVVEPALLVCDEVVSALDVSAQGSVLNLLKAYRLRTGAGLVFVSHGLPATAFVADELIVMYRGEVVERGFSSHVVTHASHWYTKKLLASYHSSSAVRSRAVRPSEQNEVAEKIAS